MGQHWYALWTKSHKERAVYDILGTHGIDAYLPLLRVQPKNPRAAKLRPYLPNYLFVNADLGATGVNYFNWLPGAHGLVSFGDRPTVVPDTLIRQIDRELSAIEKAGGLVFVDLKHGDRVRINHGPFAGYEALFDCHLKGPDRVQVLLAFLSKHGQRVQLDANAIERIR